MAKLSLIRDRKGTSMVEYVVLVGAISIIALGSLRVLSKKIVGTVLDQAAAVSAINGTAQ